MGKTMINAKEAAAELNVSRATLYAYVSRGLIASEAAPNGRHHLYNAEDVRRLRGRKTPRGTGESMARKALSFGQSDGGNIALFDSALTLIEDGKLYYRGRDAVELARNASLETIAGLLWDTRGKNPFAGPAPDAPIDLALLPTDMTGITRAQALLSMSASKDLQGLNLHHSGVPRTGARILRLVAAAFLNTTPSDAPIEQQCADAWHVSGTHRDLLRIALVLSADHELNPSTFVARCVASTRTTPYAAVLAGLSAMQGVRHGGWMARVSALFAEAEARMHPEEAVIARMQRGEELPGFGHKLYPDGDPRFTCLYNAMRDVLEHHPALDMVDAVVNQVHELTGLRPNVDMALAALQRALNLPEEAALALFAIGRTVGWIAHVQEQYALPELIRPRARYIGELPQDAAG